MSTAETLNRQILLVDDDATTRRFLRVSLEAHGYGVAESRLGEDGLAGCTQTQPDLILLDPALPDMNGIDFIVRLREWSQVPLLVLSARDAQADKVAALDAGANDYLTKPFGLFELLARIRARLRDAAQRQRPEAPVIAHGDLAIDLPTRTVTINGHPVRLSPKEYALMRMLASRPGEVLTHRQLLRDIWGPTRVEQPHHLRVLVGHLRQKLGDAPERPRYIHTEPGIGYRLVHQMD